MKRHILKSISLGIFATTLLFTTSCKEELIPTEELSQIEGDDRNAKLGIPTKFDANGFAIRIENLLEGEVGFGYAVYNNGEEFYRANGGDGFARKHFEGSFQLHGAVVKQEVLTTTQYVTAVTALRILKKYNLSLSTKVWNYLPKNWVPSSKFKELDFERLLAHRTGLIYYPNDWDKVKLTVEGPVNESIFNAKTKQNNNINYLLLGIILPYVEATELKKQGNAAKWNELNATPENFMLYGEHYRNIVRTNVFVPAGLEHATVIDWQAWGQNPWGEMGPISASLSTQGYPARNGDEPGIDKPIIRWECGATGLYLSASQFGKLASKVAKNELLTMMELNLMKSKLLGFDGKLTGTKGSYFYKTGIGHNCETIFLDFGPVQVAVFANSPQSEISNPKLIAQMYENSFVPL
ncbi:CubicO group peptidase, beta-lactamase class C family [Dyadobacter soli]|uniref:CubicO group peptidase, beta-lactamase class C family n=1 Tax=Dyadobacter soli TaxID=659014 RepID=A0A1G7SIJ4_9BACT|nr:serine hydrolase [Dyadobacter soli]SDG22865.1 CubicO group peptidase, beta-lactamase class C family [Dyadobacter soli]